MLKKFEMLAQRECCFLLELHRQIDVILDEGMVSGEKFYDTVKKTLETALGLVKFFEEEEEGSQTDRLLYVYKDHFEETVTISSDGNEFTPEELKELLNKRNLLAGGDFDPRTVKRYESSDLIIEQLEVHDRILGIAVLTGRGLKGFHRHFLSLLARKLDTDIYQHNSLVVEQLKTAGVEKINSILDSDLSLQEKYNEAMKVIVDFTNSYSGYMVVPWEGDLALSTRYIRDKDKAGLKDEEILSVARNTIEKEKDNEFVRVEEIKIPHGELLAISLKPGEKQIEGVMILHHRDFMSGHREVANSFSKLIDSSLHMNHLYADMFENFLNALGVIIDTFDTYTSGHSRRVSVYSQAVGQVLGLSRIEMTKLRIASMLHDIGKVGVDPGIIRKNTRLTPEEMQVVQTHATYSGNILEGIFPSDLEDIHQLAYSHHEKENGTGYPRHLKGDEIPILSKIISVADIFDALTSDRPYHKGRTKERAYEILDLETGEGKLAGDLVELFKEPKVWELIRNEYQSLKISSEFNWYRKFMIPDLEPVLEELGKVKECLTDLRNVKDKFEKEEEIDLVFLEDSYLRPSEKDRLLQRETQKNPVAYHELLASLDKEYKKKLSDLEARRTVETRFRDRFWEPQLVSNVFQDLNVLNGKDFDMTLPAKEIADMAKAEGIEPIGEKMCLIELVSTLLKESQEQKGLNKKYRTPVEKLHKIVEKVDKSLK